MPAPLSGPRQGLAASGHRPATGGDPGVCIGGTLRRGEPVLRDPFLSVLP